MKKWLVATLCACLMLVVGCGGGGSDGSKKDGSDDSSLLWVEANYSCEVVETENTCSGDGPREFPDPIPVAFTQVDMGTNDDGDPIPTDEVYFNGGGVAFGGVGTLTTTGAFSVTDYVMSDVMTLDYASVFEGSGGVAMNHNGVMRIDYATGACYDGNSGYNVLELACEKVEEAQSISFPPIINPDPRSMQRTHADEWRKRAGDFPVMPEDPMLDVPPSY